MIGFCAFVNVITSLSPTTMDHRPWQAITIEIPISFAVRKKSY
jgi:hypothetical protein